MSNNSDFLSWDSDLDLDLLLEEYTDYDNVDCDLGSDFETHSSTKHRKLDQENQPPKTVSISSNVTYTCPLCCKLLKTIAGFRGHTSRQHGRSDLKANQNKTSFIRDSSDNSPLTTDHSPTITAVPNPPHQSTTSDLSSTVFKEAYDSAISSLKTDDLHNLLGGSNFIALCDFSLENSSLENFYFSVFRDIFTVTGLEVSTVLEREQLLRKLHSVRVNCELRSQYEELYLELNVDIKSIHNFVQVLLLELLERILQTRITVESGASKERQLQLTDKDQQVLYYICGYLLRALSRKYSKSRDSSNKLNALQLLEHDNTTSSSFVTKYKVWTLKKDRGGLKYPSDNFYLLIREMEVSVRNLVEADSLTATSLSIDPLKEDILEQFMVKHYCDKMFNGDVSSETATAILENIIHLFLAVRGHATVRLELNKLSKTNKRTAKTSESLRGTLKK